MAGSEVSLQSLMKRYHLSEDQLEEEVSDEHLSEVSKIIEDHEIVGPELGLTKAKMTEINRDKPTHQLKKKEMLDQWKEINACTATYRVLIEALLKCGKAGHAQKVCKLLQPPSEGKCRNGGTKKDEETEGRKNEGHRNLKEFSLKNVINSLHEVGFVDADWKELGLQLDLTGHVKNIGANHREVQSCLQEMISQWMKVDTNASWEALAAALGMIQGYRCATANKLRQAVGLPADNSTGTKRASQQPPAQKKAREDIQQAGSCNLIPTNTVGPNSVPPPRMMLPPSTSIVPEGTKRTAQQPPAQKKAKEDNSTGTKRASQQPPAQKKAREADIIELYQLQKLDCGRGRGIRVMDRVSANWTDVAIALRFDGSMIGSIQADALREVKTACRIMFQKWLDGEGKRPASWEVLIQALEDAKLGELARELKKALY